MDSENSTPPQTSEEATGVAAGAKSSEQARPAEGSRVEVSAPTITRMMGIATVTDLKLVENRIELLTAKLSNMTTKLDRVISMLSSVPSAADIDRLELQIGSMKNLVREALDALPAPPGVAEEEKKESQEQSRKLREGIRSSSTTNE